MARTWRPSAENVGRPFLSISLLGVLSSCTLSPLVIEGRPCQTDEQCGWGTQCDHVTQTCAGRTSDGPLPGSDVRETHPSDLGGEGVATDGRPPATPSWSKAIGGSQEDRGVSVAVDANGNVYLAGHCRGPVTFGAGLQAGQGDLDLFLASYTGAGQLRWAKIVGSPLEDRGLAVAVDGSGNVYLAGHFQDKAQVEGQVLTSQGKFDILIASYTDSGQLRWAKAVGGAEQDYCRGLAVHSSGALFVTGTFAGTVDFGSGPSTSQSTGNVFVASYASDGQHRWSKAFASKSYASGWGIAVDGNANATVTGSFTVAGTVDFGGGPLTSHGSSDIFVAGFGSAGQHRWSKGIGATSEDSGRAVAVNGGGDVYVTGYFGGTVDFGGKSYTSPGTEDGFLASYTSAGQYRWSRALGDSTAARGRGTTVDHTGAVYVTGVFEGSLDLGNGVRTSRGLGDIILASYTDSGTYRWSRALGGGADDSGSGLAVDGSRNLFVTGYFGGPVDFGSGPLSGMGDVDAFVLKLPP